VWQQVWIRAVEGLDAEPAVFGSVVELGLCVGRATRGVNYTDRDSVWAPTLRGAGDSMVTRYVVCHDKGVRPLRVCGGVVWSLVVVLGGVL
jgi:hypothetical protein